MGLESSGYVLRTALANLRHNAVLSLIAVATTTLMLLMLVALVFTSASLQATIAALRSRVNLMVYLEDSVTDADREALAERLRGDPGVAAFEFVSKDEAWARLRAQLSDHPELLEGVAGNPLPEAFEVRLRQADYADHLAAALRGAPGVEVVVYQADVVRRLVAITNGLEVAGGTAVTALGALAAFVIVSTIRMGVYHRREEIELMKLMGATNWFVRWPFLIEGTLCGLVAATLASVAVVLAYTPALHAVTSLLDFLPVGLGPSFQFQMMAGTLLAGTLLGGLGSYLSIRRFLRV